MSNGFSYATYLIRAQTAERFAYEELETGNKAKGLEYLEEAAKNLTMARWDVLRQMGVLPK